MTSPVAAGTGPQEPRMTVSVNTGLPMITLLNAAPDTGNQGVSALCHSVVAGLVARGAKNMTIADHGRGLRREDWGYTSVNLVGLTNSKRIWRGDNLRTAHAMARVGGLISAPARAVARSRAVLDISGGDSFTDLYGAKRFQAMTLTKRMALDAGVPLILLPQKLGPFQHRDNEAAKTSYQTLYQIPAQVWHCRQTSPSPSYYASV